MQDAVAQDQEGGTDRVTGRNSSSIELSMLVPVTTAPSDHFVSFVRELETELQDISLDCELVLVVEPPHLEEIDELTPIFDEHSDSVRVVRSGFAVGEADLVKLGARRSDADIVATVPMGQSGLFKAVSRAVRQVVEGVDVVYTRADSDRQRWYARLLYGVFDPFIHSEGGYNVAESTGGFLVMRRDVVESVPVFSDSFQYFPALAARDGFVVEEFDCTDMSVEVVPFRASSSRSFLQTLFDLVRLFFLTRFTWKPLRFFGLVGSLFSVPGLVILAVLFVQRVGGKGIANRPLLLLGVLLVSLGVQAIAIGLVGELIVHLNAPRHSRYRVEELQETAPGEASEEESNSPGSSTSHSDSV